MENRFTNLLDIIPPYAPTKGECIRSLREIGELLQENGRMNYTPDEVAFITLLDRYIEIFSKAKTMVVQEKFTVMYKNAEQNSDSLSITDFEIIPIKKRDGR